MFVLTELIESSDRGGIKNSRRILVCDKEGER
jgi:hypothetical protein